MIQPHGLSHATLTRKPPFRPPEAGATQRNPYLTSRLRGDGGMAWKRRCFARSCEMYTLLLAVWVKSGCGSDRSGRMPSGGGRGNHSSLARSRSRRRRRRRLRRTPARARRFFARCSEGGRETRTHVRFYPYPTGPSFSLRLHIPPLHAESFLEMGPVFFLLPLARFPPVAAGLF